VRAGLLKKMLSNMKCSFLARRIEMSICYHRQSHIPVSLSHNLGTESSQKHGVEIVDFNASGFLLWVPMVVNLLNVEALRMS
jgi:hypothetical protein